MNKGKAAKIYMVNKEKLKEGLEKLKEEVAWLEKLLEEKVEENEEWDLLEIKSVNPIRQAGLKERIRKAKQHRSGIIICTDCGAVYEMKCTAEKCPYKGDPPLIGRCVVMSLRVRKFDVCPNLVVIKKGDISSLEDDEK